MNTKALKAKILDLAIHGKLVPQNPEHESAEKLLEKIRAEKEEKIAKGELKRDKKDSYIFVGDDNRHYEKFTDGTVKDIEDEIPFEVPEGWAWCRLGTLALDMADGPFGSNLKKEHYTTKKEARIVQLSNIGEGFWKEENTKYTTFEHAKQISRSIVEPGTLIIAKMMPAGRTIICPDYEAQYVLSSDSIKCVQTKLINQFYLLWAINSDFFRSKIADDTQGTTRARTNIAKLKSAFLPIPPRSEQDEIERYLIQAFSLIENLNSSKYELQRAIKYAKSKILDLAIHGKLVPQDPSEEPASKLLERIRAEKEAKIAAGELKRDKNDSYIYKNTSDNCHYEKFADKEICIEDEIPFALPEGWCWCRLKNIALKLVDGDHNPPKGISEETEYKMLSSRNINQNRIVDLRNVRYLSKEIFEEENKRTQLTTGDILFTSVGSLGRSCLFDGTGNYCFQRSVTVVNTTQYNPYIKFYFDSTYYQKVILENATGTAQLGFYLEQMSKSFIPIPPIAEQKRIVSKIVEVGLILDTIEQNLQ